MSELKENDIVKFKWADGFYDDGHAGNEWKILAMTADGDNTAIIENTKTKEQTIIELFKLVLC